MTKKTKKKEEKPLKEISSDLKKKPKPLSNVDKLLALLNDPLTGCKFWKAIDEECTISGIRPVKRTCLEILNPEGYNRFEKKTEEILFKYYNVEICKEEIILTDDDVKKKDDLLKKGINFIKSHDLVYIFDYIKENK